MNQAAQDKQDILTLIRSFEPLATTACESDVTKWIRQSQQSCAAKMTHPRLSVIMAAHGFADKSDLPAFESYIQTITKGNALLNELCVAANTDLRLYDMDLNHPTENCLDTSVSSACNDESFVRALAYGMMAVEPGLDVMGAYATGPGSETASRALIHLHAGQSSRENIHHLILEKLVNKAQSARGLSAVQLIGGFEIAALCGLITAARLANCPVLVTGVTGASALWCLAQENKNSIDHCAYLDYAARDIPLPETVPLLLSPHNTPQNDASALAAFFAYLRVNLLLESYQHAPKLASAA